MRVNKEQLKALASKSDAEMWQELNKIAESHGYKLPGNMPSSEDMEKIRRALLGVEKINLSDAARLLNKYKK